MKQLLVPIAFDLLFPTAATAQVDAQCKDAKDFYGCVMAFTAYPQSRGDLGPLGGAMGQIAAGLISGSSFLSIERQCLGRGHWSSKTRPTSIVDVVCWRKFYHNSTVA